MEWKEFVERLALLGITTKEDPRFGMAALFNKDKNQFIYNPRLLDGGRMVKIIEYFLEKK